MSCSGPAKVYWPLALSGALAAPGKSPEGDEPPFERQPLRAPTFPCRSAVAPRSTQPRIRWESGKWGRLAVQGL